MGTMKRIVVLLASTAVVGGLAAGAAGAQDPEPLPPGVPAWNWQ